MFIPVLVATFHKQARNNFTDVQSSSYSFPLLQERDQWDRRPNVVLYITRVGISQNAPYLPDNRTFTVSYSAITDTFFKKCILANSLLKYISINQYLTISSTNLNKTYKR